MIDCQLGIRYLSKPRDAKYRRILFVGVLKMPPTQSYIDSNYMQSIRDIGYLPVLLKWDNLTSGETEYAEIIRTS